MQPQDFQITEQVRRILARNWVDMTKLDYGTTNRVVYLRGRLQTLQGAKPAQTAQGGQTSGQAHEDQLAFISRLETEIKRIPGTSGVVINVEGFAREGGKWQSKVKA